MHVELLHFQRGEPEALAAACDLALAPAWALGAAGFVERDGALALVCQGEAAPELLFQVVERAMAGVLEPSARRSLTDLGTLGALCLEASRAALREHAMKRGRLLPLPDDAAIAELGLRQDDDLLRLPGVLPLAQPALDPEATRLWEEARTLLGAEEPALGPRAREVRERRFVRGESARATAEALGIGVAAVRSQEARLMRRTRHALRRRWPELRPGRAWLEALLAGAPHPLTLTPMTLERLRHRIVVRTHREAPPPFGPRLAWGLGATGLAILALALMVLGIVRSPTDDLRVEPRLSVRCPRGAQCEVRVVPPRRARQVAVMLVEPGQAARALVASPGGGSVLLPTGAAGRETRLPAAAGLEEAPTGARAMAVFSRERRSAAEVRRAVGGAMLDDVVVVMGEVERE